MSTSTSILAYADVRELLDRAIDSPNGIRVTLPDRLEGKPGGTATYFIQRAYKFRTLDRRENAKIYPPGEPMHGKSVYDVLVVRRGRTPQEVEVAPMSLFGLKIEDL